MARLESVADPGIDHPTVIVAIVRILRIIKGGESSSRISVQYRLRDAGLERDISLHGAIGTTGVWFLKRDGPQYDILPLVRGMPRNMDFFIAVPGFQVALVPAGTVNQQLLAYTVNMFMSISKPAAEDDAIVLAALEPGVTVTVLALDQLTAANSLVRSPLPDAHKVGLIACLRLGSLDALATFLKEMPELGTDSRYSLMTGAIMDYPKEADWIPGLQVIAAEHAYPPKLDAIIASTLAKTGSKAVLPAMALLLDSRDPQARLRAAWYFSRFTLLAGPDGAVPGLFTLGRVPDAVHGPYSTPETRRYSPIGDEMDPEKFAVFWKQWWSENKNELGF